MDGRKNLFDELEKKVKTIPRNAKIVWVHCASLGEFEQARPIIEKIKNERTDVFVVLSFFYPSGYEIRKNYAFADIVTYLPADTPSNAQRFISIVNPRLLILVKYEFWFHHLYEAQKQGCKLYLIAGRFRKQQLFFRHGMQWFKNHLQLFEVLHVQDDTSKHLLRELGVIRVLVSGDPRYDRVFQNAAQTQEMELINKWIDGRKTLVAGSTWPEDEAVILPWNQPDLALIIAPHEIGEKRLLEIEKRCEGQSIRYSSWIKNPVVVGDILIIDNIGMLMHIYKYAHIAYVGGGFRSGLHNILEPAAFGIPVIFGPRHDKFPEAQLLIEAGGALEVRNKIEFNVNLDFFNSESACTMGENARKFVINNTGATRKIIETLKL